VIVGGGVSEFKDLEADKEGTGSESTIPEGGCRFVVNGLPLSGRPLDPHVSRHTK
jgi:hypothetical protein